MNVVHIKLLIPFGTNACSDHQIEFYQQITLSNKKNKQCFKPNIQYQIKQTTKTPSDDEKSKTKITIIQ